MVIVEDWTVKRAVVAVCKYKPLAAWVAVIVAVPGPTIVTVFPEIVATLVLLLV